jgi:hypothetical protein
MGILNLKNIDGKKAAPLIVAAAALIVIAILCIVFWPRPAWYVQADFAREWGRVLWKIDPPFTRIRIYDGQAGIPKRGLGFCVTKRIEEAAEKIVIYPGLSDTGEYQGTDEYRGARVLALDPWMVFYRHSGSSLNRSRAEAPGEGTLILPGAEAGALEAWAAQTLQTRPGVFSADADEWTAAIRDLPQDTRFQKGAASYKWAEALSLLLRVENTWLYAPLSRIRELPSHRMGLLAARHFPVKSNWNEFGIQADLLWAVPVGKTGQSKKQEAWAAWLDDPLTQTAIADELRWIPAHPGGTPYNPVSRDTQLAWFSSSFVWELSDK